MTPLQIPADCQWAAFDHHGQWVLERDHMAWQQVANDLRADARREVPVLTTPSRLVPLARLITVVWFLGKAILPWMIAKRLKRYATPEASRASISRRMRLAI